MDDFNKALNVEVNKLIKWEAETDVEESETEAQLKAAVEEEAAQEVTQLHLLQERDQQRSSLREANHAR